VAGDITDLGVADFNGDGHPDVAIAIASASEVMVLNGTGDGTFEPIPAAVLDVSGSPSSLLAFDLNRDGHDDLAVADAFSNSIAIFLGNGDGSFLEQRFATGDFPVQIVLGEFNGDGLPDLVTANRLSSDLSVFISTGVGTFAPEIRFAVGFEPVGVVLSDFDGDGVIDLAVANSGSQDISLLFGFGDGTFQLGPSIDLPGRPTFTTLADVDGDQNIDLLTATSDPLGGLGTVSILLRAGDGGLQKLDVGVDPFRIVVSDLNGDSFVDLLVANRGSNDLSLLFGDEQGKFQEEKRIPVGLFPTALAAVDLNDDVAADLITASSGQSGGELQVRFGVGFASLSSGFLERNVTFRTGKEPIAIVTADFNRDRNPDLATANAGSSDLSVLLGLGQGGLEEESRIELAQSPQGLATADFNSDGRFDLATEQFRLLGLGDGQFASPTSAATAAAPVVTVTGDFNGDGLLDQATVNPGSNSIAVFLALPNGDLDTPQFFSVGVRPVAIVAEDFNRDGRLDLATANGESRDVTLLLNSGDGSFVNATEVAANSLETAPIVGDLNNDGAIDTLMLRRDGAILLRMGLPDQPGMLGGFTIINTVAARDVTIVSTGTETLIAAIDRSPQRIFGVLPPGDTVSLYSLTGVLRERLAVGSLATQVRAARLNNDVRDDLVVINAGSHAAQVFFAGAAGFRDGPLPLNLTVGSGPSDLELADADGTGTIDILVTNRLSGDVSIYRNWGNGNFAPEERYRTGTLPYGIDLQADGLHLRSLERPDALVVADVTGDRVADLLVRNSGSASFALLSGNGAGGFTNPTVITFFVADADSAQFRVADFNRDGIPDLAELLPGTGQMNIRLGADHRRISSTLTVANAPTGFSIAQTDDDNRDGSIGAGDFEDLVVGNEFGDILIFLGNGNGTFRPFQRAGLSIPLGVTLVQGLEMVVLANASLDRLSLALPDVDVTEAPAFQDRQNGVQGPENVQLADLNNDTFQDLIVANGGSNNVLVYLGKDDGSGEFEAEINGEDGFFSGTNPVGVTVGHVNPGTGASLDNFLDLIVTNRGSNDVTILLGRGDGTFTPGPRLDTGGLGPTATALSDVTGISGFRPDGTPILDGTPDGILDILVTNSQSGAVSTIPGTGGGFFNSTNPAQTLVGGSPGPIIPMPDDTFVTPNPESGDISRLRPRPGGGFQDEKIETRGDSPNTVVAGDFDGDGADDDLIVGSNSDGILELFLDDGGELISKGFLDTDLNISAVALSVIEGSRVFYVTSDGVEQAFAFTLDQFAGEDRGTVADLGDSNSVAIIAALVAGSAELSAADFFTGQDGETVNFGELLFFSENGEAPEVAGGGDSSTEALAQLQELIRQVVQDWSVTFGTGEGGGWQVIVSAVRSVLDTVGAVEVAGFNPFAGWQTVVSHLQLPGIGESLVGSIVKAGQTMLPVDQVAADMPGDAALRDFVFGSSLAAPFDGFESSAVTDEAALETSADEVLLPVDAMARWWALPVERQTEELLLAGLLAATLWKPEVIGRSVPGRRPATAPNLPR